MKLGKKGERTWPDDAQNFLSLFVHEKNHFLTFLYLKRGCIMVMLMSF